MVNKISISINVENKDIVFDFTCPKELIKKYYTNDVIEGDAANDMYYDIIMDAFKKKALSEFILGTWGESIEAHQLGLTSLWVFFLPQFLENSDKKMREEFFSDLYSAIHNVAETNIYWRFIMTTFVYSLLCAFVDEERVLSQDSFVGEGFLTFAEINIEDEEIASLPQKLEEFFKKKQEE